MYQGNWKCSSCGGPITELPFQPRSEAGLTCRTCYAKQRDQGSQTTPPPTAVTDEPPAIPDFAEIATEPPSGDDGFGPAVPATPGDKPRFTGNWVCSGCGASITSLPFSPRDTSNLKCIDCFKASKG
jgi:CxxC-x17-CxxC domain-containing protein